MPKLERCICSIIDRAPATAEYKLLQLRQYLDGNALKAIENLGHSSVAYGAAKEHLECKYGDRHRHLAVNLQELETFSKYRSEIQGIWKNFLTCLR